VQQPLRSFSYNLGFALPTLAFGATGLRVEAFC